MTPTEPLPEEIVSLAQENRRLDRAQAHEAGFARGVEASRQLVLANKLQDSIFGPLYLVAWNAACDVISSELEKLEPK